MHFPTSQSIKWNGSFVFCVCLSFFCAITVYSQKNLLWIMDTEPTLLVILLCTVTEFRGMTFLAKDHSCFSFCWGSTLSVHRHLEQKYSSWDTKTQTNKAFIQSCWCCRDLLFPTRTEACWDCICLGWRLRKDVPIPEQSNTVTMPECNFSLHMYHYRCLPQITLTSHSWPHTQVLVHRLLWGGVIINKHKHEIEWNVL